MLNRTVLIDEIGEYIYAWYQKIKRDSFLMHTDRNKDSESLAAQLLNEVYNYQLKNLNDMNNNNKGIDLGDDNKAYLCVQVTSSLDPEKIIKTLNYYVDPDDNYSAIYYSGVKIFYLNIDTPKISGKKRKEILAIHPKFSFENDIITYEKLIKSLNAIDDVNQLRIILKLLRDNIHYYKRYDIQTDQNHIWGQLLVNRTINRIKEFEDFYNTIWTHPRLSDEIFMSGLERLTQLDQGLATQLSTLLENLQYTRTALPSPLKPLFEEFLVIERKVIKEAFKNLKSDPIGLFEKTGKDYQNHVRYGLEMLIDKMIYNLNYVEDILGYQYSGVIENRFRHVRKIINYSSINDRNEKLRCLLGEVSEINPFKIDVFTIKEDNHDFHETYSEYEFMAYTKVLYLDFEYAAHYIAFTMESVNPDDGFIASGISKVASQLIFLYEISHAQKAKLYEIQNRSNIAFYFFEKM